MSSPGTPAAASLAAPLAERQLALLGKLAEIGLEVAMAVEKRAKAAAAQDDLAGLAMAYARVSRAVRLTVMLQTRLIRDLHAFEAEAGRRAAGASYSETRARERMTDDRKARVARILERVIACEGEDQDDIERLASEAGEWLNDDDLCGDVLERPIGAVVAMICRDLGLDPDWSEWAVEGWARAEIESGAEGSPFLDPPRPPPSCGGGEPLEGVEGARLGAGPSPFDNPLAADSA